MVTLIDLLVIIAFCLAHALIMLGIKLDVGLTVAIKRARQMALLPYISN